MNCHRLLASRFDLVVIIMIEVGKLVKYKLEMIHGWDM
jgi:hypothetical protein